MELNDNDKFTCAICNETFVKGWSEEEAEDEFKSSPWYKPNEDAVIVCDDCFKEFKIWFGY